MSHQERMRQQMLLTLAIGAATGDVTEAVDSVQGVERGRTVGPKDVKMPWAGDEVLALKMRRGQIYDTLYIARDMKPQDKARLESEGCLFYEMGQDPDRSDDPVLQTMRVPPGWQFRPYGDNGYGSELWDAQGRCRGSQFYKAAFYDRNARFFLYNRYRWDSEYCQYLPPEQRPESVRHLSKYSRWPQDSETPYERFYIQDRATGQRLWEGPWMSYDESKAQYIHGRKALPAEKTGSDWIEAHYPDYANPYAYWDDEVKS
jgi:hypothetical protein